MVSGANRSLSFAKLVQTQSRRDLFSLAQLDRIGELLVASAAQERARSNQIKSLKTKAFRKSDFKEEIRLWDEIAQDMHRRALAQAAERLAAEQAAKKAAEEIAMLEAIERKARQESEMMERERQAEEAERKAKDEAQRRIQEEAERVARLNAERKAKEEHERKAREAAAVEQEAAEERARMRLSGAMARRKLFIKLGASVGGLALIAGFVVGSPFIALPSGDEKCSASLSEAMGIAVAVSGCIRPTDILSPIKSQGLSFGKTQLSGLTAPIQTASFLTLKPRVSALNIEKALFPHGSLNDFFALKLSGPLLSLREVSIADAQIAWGPFTVAGSMKAAFFDGSLSSIEMTLAQGGKITFSKDANNLLFSIEAKGSQLPVFWAKGHESFAQGAVLANGTLSGRDAALKGSFGQLRNEFVFSPLEGKISGAADLTQGEAQIIFPELFASGAVKANGKIEGPWANPTFSGSFEIADGAFATWNLAQELGSGNTVGGTRFSSFNGSFSLSKDKLSLLDATLLTGTLKGVGSLERDANGAVTGQLLFTVKTPGGNQTRSVSPPAAK